MIGSPGPAPGRQFRTLFGAGPAAGMSDGQLLERFLKRRDEAGEAAFAALVARHGPMVLGVCRRALADPDDVADAFQATFLVLVRKARSVRVDDSLGRWLYGVSRKVASRARAVAARRPRPGAALHGIEAGWVDPDRFELVALLDEELARLPEVYRSAIVLCDLGGMPLEEAARALARPVGTIKSRLARGRLKLRERLERRGMTPSSLMALPAVPASLVDATARIAVLTTISGATAAGMVPASAALAQEVLKAMSGFKLKLAAATVLSLGLAATGAGVVARGQAGDAKPALGTSREAAAPAQGPIEPRLAELDVELGRAREALTKLRRIARPGDPALRRALMRVSELEAAVVRIDETLKTALDNQAGPDRKPKTVPPSVRPRITRPDYVVDPPDILVVEVLEALPGRPITGERLVRPDGKISLGYYSDVEVAGLTPVQVKEKVIRHLREWLTDELLGLTRVDAETGKVEAVEPAKSIRVSVDVASYNSKVYYVQGDVGSPGRLPITGNDTVLDAINYAGGLIPTSDKANVRLVRPAQPGTCCEQTLPVDLAAIVERGETKTNYQLLPGDRLVVTRDPKETAAILESKPAAPGDAEARLQAVERKLDEVLKALERLSKP